MLTGRTLFFPFRLPLLLVVFLLTLAVLLPGIGEATGITGKDEFFLGLRTPLEMMQGDHWLVPFLDDAPRIKKPPLLYWLGRIQFELFGPSLVSARFLSVLFASLLVLSTAGIARRLNGTPGSGLIAAIILLGCLGLHSEGRRFMLDVPVAALSTAAFWSFLVWLEQKRWPWLSACALLLAAGFLCKGPIVALVFGGGLAGLLFSGQLPAARLRPHWPSLLGHSILALALALPWFFVVRTLYPEAAQLALADEVESRQFLHLTPQILLGLLNISLPWGIVFLATAWARRKEPGSPRMLLAWFLITFLPFLFLKSFDRYLIGSLVPLAIFLAAIRPDLGPRWAFRLGAGLAIGLGGCLAVFAYCFNLGGWFWLPVPAAYLAWSWWQERALTHTLAAPTLFWLALLGGVFPALGINAVPETVLDLGKARNIALFDGPQPALLPILSGRALRHYTHVDHHDAAELHALKALIFVESDDAPRLLRQLAVTGFAAEQAGAYKALASHGSGLRFARPGATLADWEQALATRRLDPLMTTVEWYTLRPR